MTMMKRAVKSMLLAGLAGAMLASCARPVVEKIPLDEMDLQAKFAYLNGLDWQTVFTDDMTGDWTEQWMLDGENARIEQNRDGMELHAGPEYLNDADHVVLWTKPEFAGPVRIEYEFTRLDDEVKCVCILYIQATGSGTGPYAKDIAEWADLRTTPAMSHYFDHMHALHVSYAAFEHSNTDADNDYIRARRYMPERSGLAGTELEPDNLGTGMFKRGVPHRMTAIKHGDDLFLRVDNGETVRLCHWDTSGFPAVEEGRVGLRQMYTRSARYKDFRVSVLGSR